LRREDGIKLIQSPYPDASACPDVGFFYFILKGAYQACLPQKKRSNPLKKRKKSEF
jgi:hypothetical protein